MCEGPSWDPLGSGPAGGSCPVLMSLGLQQPGGLGRGRGSRGKHRQEGCRTLTGFGLQSALMLTQVHKELRQSAQKSFFFSQHWHLLGWLVLVLFLEGQWGEFGSMFLFLSQSEVQPAHPPKTGMPTALLGLSRGWLGDSCSWRGTGGVWGWGWQENCRDCCGTGTEPPGHGQSSGTGTEPQAATSRCRLPPMCCGMCPHLLQGAPTFLQCPQPLQDITPDVLWDTPSIYHSTPGGSPNNPLGRCPRHFAGCPPAALGHPPAPPRAVPRAVPSPPLPRMPPPPPGLHQAPWLGGVRAASRCRGGGDSRRGARQPPAL